MDIQCRNNGSLKNAGIVRSIIDRSNSGNCEFEESADRREKGVGLTMERD